MILTLEIFFLFAKMFSKLSAADLLYEGKDKTLSMDIYFVDLNFNFISIFKNCLLWTCIYNIPERKAYHLEHGKFNLVTKLNTLWAKEKLPVVHCYIFVSNNIS